MTAPQYATMAQLQTHVDIRVLKMLESDTGADATLTNFTTAPNCGAAVEWASSEIESYARRGNRYTSTNLSDLLTAADTTLIGLTCDLALWHLATRRGGDISPAIDARYQNARQSLRALANGDRIFGMDSGAEGAGTIDAVVVPATTRPYLNLVSSSEYFPPDQDAIY